MHDRLKIKIGTYEWLIVCGIFCDFYIELLCLIISLALYINSTKKIYLNHSIFLILIIIFLSSSLNIITLKYDFDKFFQQFCLVSTFILFYYLIFRELKNNISSIFKKYIKVSYIISLIGLFQFLIYFVSGFNICGIIHNSSTEILPHIIRINSIVDEPSYLSMTLTPAIVYYINNSFSNKIESYVICSCFFLTFSTTSFFIILLAILYRIILRRRYKLILTSCFGLIIGLSFLGIEVKTEGNNNEIIRRITDTINGLSSLDPTNFEGLNLSTYSLLTNTWVAFNAPHRLTGTGLGTHEQNYINTYKSDYSEYGVNKEDGYSLFNRVYSEFGLIGCFVMVGFIFKFFNKNSIINVSIVFVLLTFLLRGGHYVRYGFIFWVFMYYFSSFPLKNRCITNDYIR